MKKPSFTPFQILVHLGAWVPLALLARDALTNNLTANPIQAVEIRLGDTAIILLILSLAITPLNTLLSLPALIKVRRPLGLYAYMYAGLHVLTYIGLDYGFDPGMIWQTVAEKPFIVVGLLCFLLLTPLAITSIRGWKARLGKRWKQLHSLVYPINLLVVLHFGWSVKGDFFRLHGDVLRPLIAALCVLLLLTLRVPAVRRSVAGRLSSLFAWTKRARRPLRDVKSV